MSNIYLKSADERTVVKLSNPKVEPELPQYFFDEGYKVVDYAEFKKVRAKIQRRSRAARPTPRALDEGDSATFTSLS